MEHSPNPLRVCAAATHHPLDERTFSGLSAHLFRALLTRGALVRAIRTRSIGWREVRAGAINPWPMLRGHRPTLRAQWKWSRAACERQSRSASAQIRSWDLDVILQVGTHALLEHSRARLTCITDTTVVQAARAGRFSVSRSKRLEEAIAWQQQVFDHQDRIFVLSEWAARSVIDDYGIACDRVVVTGAGANLDRPPTRTGDRPLLLFVGRDWENKGGPAIIDAFQRARRLVPELELAIVGCTPQLSIPGVRVVGVLRRSVPSERAALYDLYGSARAFVLCPEFDAFPNVLLEAQLSGLPVISYNDGSRPEAVVSGQTGILVDRTDPLALAEAFVTLGSDAHRAREMGHAAQAFAQQRFSWPVVADQLIAEMGWATKTYSRPVA